MRANASRLWLCSCNVPWPKCEVHRRPMARTKAVPLHKIRKRNLLREYGTDKPIPRRRNLAGNEPATNENSSGGFKHANKAQRDQSSQLAYKRLKRSQLGPPSVDLRVMSPHVAAEDQHGISDEAASSHELRSISHELSHKRKLDTENCFEAESTQRRSCIRLPAGSKLALRFPHLAMQGDLQHGLKDAIAKRSHDIDAHAESNKRRRKLPFKIGGSRAGQCADSSIE